MPVMRVRPKSCQLCPIMMREAWLTVMILIPEVALTTMTMTYAQLKRITGSGMSKDSRACITRYSLSQLPCGVTLYRPVIIIDIISTY